MRSIFSVCATMSSASRRGLSMPRARKSSVAHFTSEPMVQLFGAAGGVWLGSAGKLRALRGHDALDLAADLGELGLGARLEAHDQDRARVRRAHEAPLGRGAGAGERDARAVDVEDGVPLLLEVTRDGGDDLELDARPGSRRAAPASRTSSGRRRASRRAGADPSRGSRGGEAPRRSRRRSRSSDRRRRCDRSSRRRAARRSPSSSS